MHAMHGNTPQFSNGGDVPVALLLRLHDGHLQATSKDRLSGTYLLTQPTWLGAHTLPRLRAGTDKEALGELSSGLRVALPRLAEEIMHDVNRVEYAAVCKGWCQMPVSHAIMETRVAGSILILYWTGHHADPPGRSEPGRKKRKQGLISPAEVRTNLRLMDTETLTPDSITLSTPGLLTSADINDLIKVLKKVAIELPRRVEPMGLVASRDDAGYRVYGRNAVGETVARSRAAWGRLGLWHPGGDPRRVYTAKGLRIETLQVHGGCTMDHPMMQALDLLAALIPVVPLSFRFASLEYWQAYEYAALDVLGVSLRPKNWAHAICERGLHPATLMSRNACAVTRVMSLGPWRPETPWPHRLVGGFRYLSDLGARLVEGQRYQPTIERLYE